MKFIAEYFITAVFLTMFFLYLLYPNPEVIIKYPSPDQEMSDVYVDDNNVCYRYKRREVELKT